MLSLGLSVPLALTVGAALALAVAVAGRTERHQSSLGRLASRPIWLDLALLASVAGILALTLNPKNERNEIQLIPFGDLFDALLVPVDERLLLAAAANLLLFIPFGAALNMRGLSQGKTVLVAFGLTLCVEGAQLLFVSGRTTSVDDLLLNTIGATVGHGLCRWLPARNRLP